MIDDMTALKQAMAQMDAEDPAAAEAAKARAAQILGDAKLSFSKMAELIEQRQLLLRPKIVTNIKRMDLPDMLGDAAFRDAGSALRREGQSFRQIAESLELNAGTAPRYQGPVQTSEPLHTEMTITEPMEPLWFRVLAFVVRIIFFPLRHPFRFFTVALLAFVLFNAVRGFVGFSQQVSGFVDLVASARQLADRITGGRVGKPTSQQTQEAAASPTPPTPSPSPAATTPSAVPSAAPAPAPTANETPLPAPSSAASAPSVSTPRFDARGNPSRSPALQRRDFVNLMPDGLRRSSRSAGPCIGGIGGCYWGGGRY